VSRELLAALANFGEFTPAEQECISRKVRKLRDEGKEQDQAIAIAISVCAPEKSRSKKATSMTAGGYRASRAGDVLTIHEVPIFVECERNGVAFDATWIASAVEKAKVAERDGYLPPMHVRHHDRATAAADAVRAAGYFRITGARIIAFKGEKRTAVIADLIVTDADVREDVLAGRLPYRSVEIFDVDKPSLDGLALLDHEAPFLELPMLVVSKPPIPGGTFAREWSIDVDAASPALACFRLGSGAHLLFRAEDKTMAETESPAKARRKREPNLFAKDDEDDDEKMQDGGIDAKAVAKAIEDGSISLADMDMIEAAIQKRKAAGAPEDVEAPALVPGGESMKKGNDMDERFARLAGENAAMRAEVEAMKAEAARRREVGEAMQKLAGRPLGADLEVRLVAFHKEHGSKAFAAYVDAMARAVPQADDDVATDSGEQVNISAAAMKFQKDGPDAVERAAKFAREWRTLRDRGYTRLSEERYVEINMGLQNGMVR
jgi:hypothetical protein